MADTAGGTYFRHLYDFFMPAKLEFEKRIALAGAIGVDRAFALL